MKALFTTKTLRTRYMMILMAFLVTAVTGCATIEGAGKDVESAGEAVQDAADGD